MQNATQRDYYETVGVSENASQDEIRAAYRELARTLHPDKTGGDEDAEDRLKEINAAYDTLKNPEKRKEYDRKRSFGGQGFEGSGGFDFSGAGASGAGFADIFSSIFGGGHQAPPRPMAHRGADLEARIAVTLQDVATGTSKSLRIRRHESCSACDGSGAAPGTTATACMECGGAGQVTHGDGMFQMRQRCPRCRGLGTIISTPCSTCAGSGRKKTKREISVSIPSGVQSGTRLRLAGEGEAGYRGGARGDLYVRVELKPDPFFVREGQDIVCEVPVTFAEAALGARIDVPTLDGIAKVTVKPGTQNGTLLRMRQMGLPTLGGTARGDELIKVRVEVPKKLTRNQIKLLKQFDGELEPVNHKLREAFHKLMKRLRGPD